MDLEGIQRPPGLVGVLALNSTADVSFVKSSLEHFCEPTLNNAFAVPKWVDKNTEIAVFTMKRDELAVLDWCKVLDLLIVTVSCVGVDCSVIKTDPDTCQVIDELGYSFITAMKTQGMPNTLCFVQDTSEIPDQTKLKSLKRLFTRYLESEFPNSKVFFGNYEALLRTMGPALYSQALPE